MKSILLILCAFAGFNVAAAPATTKYKRVCTLDQVVKTYDAQGNLTNESIFNEVASESTRTTFTKPNGAQYRITEYKAISGNDRPLTGYAQAIITTTPQNDGSFLEKTRSNWIFVYNDPYTNENGDQVEGDQREIEDRYRVSGNVKTYFEPGTANVPERVTMTVTTKTVSATQFTEFTEYPVAETATKDGGKVVVERNNSSCTYDAI